MIGIVTYVQRQPKRFNIIYLLIISKTIASLEHHHNLNNSNNNITQRQAESYQTAPCYIVT